MSTTWLVISVAAVVALASLAWWRLVALDTWRARRRRLLQLLGSVVAGVGGATVLRALAEWSLTRWEVGVLGTLLGLAVSVAAPEAWRIVRLWGEARASRPPPRDWREWHDRDGEP